MSLWTWAIKAGSGHASCGHDLEQVGATQAVGSAACTEHSHELIDGLHCVLNVSEVATATDDHVIGHGKDALAGVDLGSATVVACMERGRKVSAHFVVEALGQARALFPSRD